MATVDKKLAKLTTTADGKRADEKLDQHEKCALDIGVFSSADVYTCNADMNLAGPGALSPS